MSCVLLAAASCSSTHTRLDVEMTGQRDWVAVCNHMGGEPIYYPWNGRQVCEDVDK